MRIIHNRISSMCHPGDTFTTQDGPEEWTVISATWLTPDALEEIVDRWIAAQPAMDEIVRVDDLRDAIRGWF